MNSASFHSPRVLLVLLVLFVLAQWNIARARRRQFADVHQRRLLFHTILACGLIAGCFGALMDQLTLTVSPHYFSVFKDLPSYSLLELRLRAADLGFAAGFVPGLIAGVCLGIAATVGVDLDWLKTRKMPLKYLFLPATLILLLSPIFAWYQMNWDPGDYLASMANANAARNMVAVWGVHQAAYVGGFVGTIIATIKLRREVELGQSAHQAAAGQDT